MEENKTNTRATLELNVRLLYIHSILLSSLLGTANPAFHED